MNVAMRLLEKNDRKKGVDCYVCHVDCGNCVFGGQGNWVWGFVLDAVPFGSVAPMSVRPYCSICLQFFYVLSERKSYRQY